MGSKIALKNVQDQEFAINHPDNAGAISINSNDIVRKSTAVTDNAIVRFDGTMGTIQNSSVIIVDNGSLLLTSATGVLGYGTGAGGTVTQLTSKGTAVTLNKPTGFITMNASLLPASETVSFLLNNSTISSLDKILITLSGGAYSPSFYNVWAYTVDGAAAIYIKNISGISASENVVLSFAVIKGATT